MTEKSAGEPRPVWIAPRDTYIDEVAAFVPDRVDASPLDRNLGRDGVSEAMRRAVEERGDNLCVWLHRGERYTGDESAMMQAMAESEPCPFCERISAGAVERRTASAVSFPDGFPVSPGHTLVVPIRHEASFFALTQDDQDDLWRLACEVRDDLTRRLSPDGFNLGINDGAAAGQTVAHAHLHVIPRFLGDVPDPRGGIRWVLPGTAAYWDE